MNPDDATIHVGIETPDGHLSSHIDTTNQPPAIAEAIMAAVRGVAAMYGTDLQLAMSVQQEQQ